MPKNPARLAASALIAITLGVHPDARADDFVYRYEGDVLPQDAGWLAGGCEGPCSEAIEDGHFVLRWSYEGTLVTYFYWIATVNDPPPPLPAWIEWNFRSDEQKPPDSYTCDATLGIQYHDVLEVVFLFADAVISFDGGSGVIGLDPTTFHTYRFETPDGTHFSFAVDGNVFWTGVDHEGTRAHKVSFHGDGACDYKLLPATNEWDFVRYGTISYGEKIVSADPPPGFLRPEDFPALDRLTVRFDQPNYVYVDESSVETIPYADSEAVAFPYPDRKGGAESEPRAPASGSARGTDTDPHGARAPRRHVPYPDRPSGPRTEVRGSWSSPRIGNWKSAIGNPPPTVVATRRLDNGPPDVVELVLDKPIPVDARTVFTFDDGTIRQTVAYTYIQGDANADGRFDLRDAAELQNCFRDETVAGHCWAFDLDADNHISLEDYAAFRPLLTGPE